MASNTFTFDPKAGTLSAVSNLQVSREHTCDCGAQFTFTMEWPENLTYEGVISLKQGQCPMCHQAILLPKARYWVEAFQLRSEPLPE